MAAIRLTGRDAEDVLAGRRPDARADAEADDLAGLAALVAVLHASRELEPPPPMSSELRREIADGVRPASLDRRRAAAEAPPAAIRPASRAGYRRPAISLAAAAVLLVGVVLTFSRPGDDTGVDDPGSGVGSSTATELRPPDPSKRPSAPTDLRPTTTAPPSTTAMPPSTPAPTPPPPGPADASATASTAPPGTVGWPGGFSWPDSWGTLGRDADRTPDGDGDGDADGRGSGSGTGPDTGPVGGSGDLPTREPNATTDAPEPGDGDAPPSSGTSSTTAPPTDGSTTTTVEPQGDSSTSSTTVPSTSTTGGDDRDDGWDWDWFGGSG